MHSIPVKGGRHYTELGALALIWVLTREVSIEHVISIHS